MQPLKYRLYSSLWLIRWNMKHNPDEIVGYICVVIAAILFAGYLVYSKA